MFGWQATCPTQKHIMCSVPLRVNVFVILPICKKALCGDVVKILSAGRRVPYGSGTNREEILPAYRTTCLQPEVPTYLGR